MVQNVRIDEEQNFMKLTPNHALPGPEISCMDPAEMLVDGFIKDHLQSPCLWHPEDRNELVRRIVTLLGMQREALKIESVNSSKEMAESANITWQNQQMSTLSVASHLLDLITKYAAKMEAL